MGKGIWRDNLGIQRWKEEQAAAKYRATSSSSSYGGSPYYLDIPIAYHDPIIMVQEETERAEKAKQEAIRKQTVNKLLLDVYNKRNVNDYYTVEELRQKAIEKILWQDKFGSYETAVSAIKLWDAVICGNIHALLDLFGMYARNELTPEDPLIPYIFYKTLQILPKIEICHIPEFVLRGKEANRRVEPIAITLLNLIKKNNDELKNYLINNKIIDLYREEFNKNYQLSKELYQLSNESYLKNHIISSAIVHDPQFSLRTYKYWKYWIDSEGSWVNDVLKTEDSPWIEAKTQDVSKAWDKAIQWFNDLSGTTQSISSYWNNYMDEQARIIRDKTLLPSNNPGYYAYTLNEMRVASLNNTVPKSKITFIWKSFTCGDGGGAFDLYKIYQNGIKCPENPKYGIVKNPVLSKIFWGLAIKYTSDTLSYDLRIDRESNPPSLTNDEKSMVDIIWREFLIAQNSVFYTEVSDSIIQAELDLFNRVIHNHRQLLENKLEINSMSTWLELMTEYPTQSYEETPDPSSVHLLAEPSHGCSLM